MDIEKSKLNSFLNRLKKKKFGDCTIQLSSVLEWCNNNDLIPEDDNHVFVANYEISSTDDDKPTMRMFFTTKRLIGLAHHNSVHICADATYKLIWQGYPVLIVGTTDKEKKFHPFGLAVCMNETEEDFSFIFRSLKLTVNRICNFNYQPTTLIADASGAITKGFQAAFDNLDRRVMCWAQSCDELLNSETKLWRIELQDSNWKLGYVQLSILQ